MSIRNTPYNFGWLAIALHWLLFILIAGLVASGKYSSTLPPGEKIFQLIGAHKQVGVAVLVLMMFRLLWRLINPGVKSLSEGALLILLAKLNHWLLYAVIMTQALTGIIMSQLSDRAVHFLGLTVPKLVGEGSLFGAATFLADPKQLRLWHEYGGYAIGALVGIHVLAALAHHFLWADDTLRRMWFGYTPPHQKELRSKQI